MADEFRKNAGKRLLSQAIDELADQQPGRKVCSMPKGLSVADGFHDLTYKELAHAVNYTAWWIEKTLGRSSNHETVTYIGTNDVRYLALVVACNKTGYKPLLASTRNSDQAHIHLLKATECSKLVCSAERRQRAMEIGTLQPGLQIFDFPSLSEMLGTSTSVYPFTKTFDEVEDDVAFIIHSSGTTGMPKPVYLTHGFLAAMDNAAYVPVPSGRASAIPNRLGSDDLILATTPFFHLMGFFLFVEAVFHGIPFVLAPDKPVSSELMSDVMNATKPTAAVFPPSLLEDMCKSSTAMDALSNLKYVYFGGGPLAPGVGHQISERTHLVTLIGSSEAGLILSILPEHREDWAYFEWNPNFGIEMQPATDNLCEMVFQRGETRDIHGIFHTFPNIKEYHTKDLFSPHPTRPNLWRFEGRLDDVIVLSNGEKFNPVTMEKTIEGHPLISRAVVVGQGRFQCALLVEPNWNQWSEDQPVSELVEKIWPTVQHANHVSLAHGRIMKDKIGVASQSKPFKTTPKGSTQRRKVIEDYKDEIDDIYAGEDEENEFELPEGEDLSSVKEYVRKVVSHILGSPELSDKADFYTAGLDSLQTMHLTKVLQGAIRSRYPEKKFEDFTAQKIYANPTVEQLSRLVYGLIHGELAEDVSRSEKINSLVEKYTINLPEQVLDVLNTPDKHSVILTGSTGSLGNYLLSVLLNDPSVAKVYCLNRSDAKGRQVKSFEEKGLNFDAAAEAKVEFLTVSFGEERFGLDASKYEEMIRCVDTIIHNAWRVDFNISVDSFEDVHIRGVRRFVDFSLQSTHHAHIHFVSSVSTIGAWKAIHGPVVPEEPIEDCEVALAQGYGESKHVSERICLAASRRAGVPTTLLRVGQIAGPTTQKGLWNRQEWLPTIVATSKATGKVPITLGAMPVDWIPVDTLATIIAELINTRRTTQAETRCAVFHLMNPSITSWDSLLPAIQKRYKVQPVELSEWVADLGRIENPSAEEIAAKPALKLLDFYRGLLGGEGALSAPVEVGKTKEASATMNSLGPVSTSLLENWMDQWAF